MKTTGLAVTLVLGVLLGALALLLINTSFMLYDDEGYVLITYREFIAGKRLYTDVFSQYGPVPYIYNWLVSRGLDAPLTHLLGRGLTALHWTASALLAGVLALTLTRDRTTSLATCLFAFSLLWMMIQEPSHPGGLICLVLMAAISIVCASCEAGRPYRLVLALGAAVALLLFTKINVGLLFAAGGGAALLLMTDWPARVRPYATACAVIGLLLVPWVLMHDRLGESGALSFPLHFTLATGALLWLLTSTPSPTGFSCRHGWVGLAAFLCASAVICAVILLRGTRLPEIVRGVLLDPLRHPAHFLLPLKWSPWLWPVAAAGAIASLTAGRQLRRDGRLGARTRGAVHVLRLAAVAGFFVFAERWTTSDGPHAFITCGLVLLPLFLIPTRGQGISAVRAWAVLLAYPQVLHAYPVAGSQMAWGSFALLPVFAAGMFDTCRERCPRIPIVRHLPRLALAVACLPIALLVMTGWDRFVTARPLDLPGGEDIRIDEPTRQLLRVMTLNAGVHSDMLFSRPGMFSYNLWSDVPPPTSQNATHWFWLLDHQAQERIISALSSTPRSAVISSTLLEDFLARIGVPMTSPLQDYISGSFKPLFRLNGHSFHVPNASRAVPFGLVEIFRASAAETDAPPVLLQSHVALNGRPAAASLRALQSPGFIVRTYPASQVSIAPITSQGAELGEYVGLDACGELRGLYRIRVFTGEQPPPNMRRHLLLTITGADGGILSESVFP